MTWILIPFLFGLLCWQVLDRAYLGPAGRRSRPARWRDAAVIVLLFVFAGLVLWQIYIILRPG